MTNKKLYTANQLVADAVIALAEDLATEATEFDHELVNLWRRVADMASDVDGYCGECGGGEDGAA